MALLSTLTDDFSGTLAKWTVNGAAITGTQQLGVNCTQNAGAAVYSSAKSAVGYTWQGSSLFFEVVAMPATAGTSNANAQFWVMDPNPANTVDRLGFEYVCAANRLDLIGQSGATYAGIGATTSLTYSPTTMRWLRIDNTGTTIDWYTSPNGTAWTLQRTYNVIPTWAAKATLLADFDAFRTTGVNDQLLIDNVNLAPVTSVLTGSFWSMGAL